ncbi:hypothetical protein N7E81_05470 [Reichenbachiella carrageenanivorans]|uniref:Outer membrane protein beta-barrel domain-containing protein n=1 Tax=Reichenbachiella carrageenanivorans TaxID=2979869 RepID=A0ABY6D652_9BACT|nr:hypothetical protein [Reichenbachiella carrageenanivorans]UXX80548.1 hypothetical protein N7E81_05470 [Reichenbachiella carrageenanivorans]
MKKLFTLLAAVLVGSSVYAQEGSMYVGGAIGFQEDYVKIAPEVGTWLKNDLQLGAVLNYTSDKTSGVGAEMSIIAPHVYLRKWWPISEKFSLYIGANARFNKVGGDFDESAFEAFVDAGFALSLAERWGIVGRAGQGLGLFANDSYTDTNFALDFNMSPASMFNVGIYYTFKQ